MSAVRRTSKAIVTTTNKIKNDTTILLKKVAMAPVSLKKSRKDFVLSTNEMPNSNDINNMNIHSILQVNGHQNNESGDDANDGKNNRNLLVNETSKSKGNSSSSEIKEIEEGMSLSVYKEFRNDLKSFYCNSNNFNDLP